MKQGWNNNDACRSVGVCRKTGTRWRLGRTETKNGHVHSYPAVEPVNTAISARFLSEQERVWIADLHRAGKSMRFIAAELGRAVSTISRELRRNRDPSGRGYLPHTARRLAATRRLGPKTTRLTADPLLRRVIDSLLGKRHSYGKRPDALLRWTFRGFVVTTAVPWAGRFHLEGKALT